MPTTILLKLSAYLGIALAILIGWEAMTSHYDQQGYDRAKAEYQIAAQEQAARNRELQRSAELRYVVQREAQDRYFVATVREVKDAAAPLAACPVPDRLRVLLNHAIACAGSNPPSTCGAADEVPGAAAPAGSSDGE